MRLLVTGGAGFIGSNFVRYVLGATADSIITVDRLTYAGSKANLEGVLDHARHEFIEGDIRDQELVDDLVARADAVVNFAAESHVDRSIDEAQAFVETNIQGTRTLLDAARETDIKRFVQISTDEVYGEILEGTFKESDPLNPRNPYAATKAAADLLAQSYHTTYEIPILITRSSNNFGPRQHPEKLIPKFIKHASKGKSLPLYGDGSNVREWTYVLDNCRAINTVLREGAVGETYNIGSGTELSNAEIAKKVVDAVGASQDLIEFIDDRPGHDQRYALDTSKVTQFGWEPDWSFDSGFAQTVEYYQ